jgi:hypothetical protein
MKTLTTQNFLRTIASEQASSKHGAAHIPASLEWRARALISAGLLGVQRAPLNAPDLYCYLTQGGLAAL